MNNFSRDTSTGKLFELRTKGKALGIPLHKKELGKYVKKQTGKYYSLTQIRPSKKNNIPDDPFKRAEMFKGQYILTRALEPDEAYLDIEHSALTVFEKKFQKKPGSVDEKLQTCPFKIQQYRKVADALGIKTVYYIFILSEHFNHAYYQEHLDFIKSIPGCDYFFVKDENEGD